MTLDAYQRLYGHSDTEKLQHKRAAKDELGIAIKSLFKSKLVAEEQQRSEAAEKLLKNMFEPQPGKRQD